MRIGLRVQQLIFGEQGLVFLVKRKETNEYFYYPAAELFKNDQLINEFSHIDVRLIAYFATAEEQQSDKIFLQKIHNHS